VQPTAGCLVCAGAVCGRCTSPDPQLWLCPACRSLVRIPRREARRAGLLEQRFGGVALVGADARYEVAVASTKPGWKVSRRVVGQPWPQDPSRVRHLTAESPAGGFIAARVDASAASGR
jgi:hypothetical protein